VTEINSRIEVLKELVRESHYVVDPRAVANAIILRSMARSVVPGVTFRSTANSVRVRSFGPTAESGLFG